MGTHPSGPAKIHRTGRLLSDWLLDHPSSVGTVPAGYSADNLPFLFKVLSVETALSLQTHPNKALAQQLHGSFPDTYKDPNHKPEMVIALTPFTCLCGFRALNEITDHLLSYPEFRGVLDHKGKLQLAFIGRRLSITPHFQCFFFQVTL
jgi:mannose-6-phosphate isomerase